MPTLREGWRALFLLAVQYAFSTGGLKSAIRVLVMALDPGVLMILLLPEGELKVPVYPLSSMLLLLDDWYILNRVIDASYRQVLTWMKSLPGIEMVQ
jgi:hypothetical protein